MFKKKIFLFLMIVAVSVSLLSSVSFTNQEEDISGSFAVRASIDSTNSSTDIVRTVASIKVEALTDSIALSVEKEVDRASKDIYAAYLKAEEERKTAEEAARQAEAASIVKEEARKAESKAGSGSSGGPGLSGIEAEILQLINSTRAQHGLSQLVLDQSLINIARARCHCMISNNYFSHYAPDGSTFFNLLRNNGISWTNAGENLGNATPANYGTPGAFLNAWMKSPSHRDNMLRSNYRMVGVGIIDGGGRRVVTTIFLN